LINNKLNRLKSIMKKYIIYIGFTLVGMGIISCNKDGFNYKTGYVGISKITYYPIFNINGSPDTSIIVGKSYIDPEVTALQGTTKLKVTTSGTVNINQVGIYTLNYSATNSDGFPGTATRIVAVLPSAEAPGVDISGAYTYTGSGNNPSATITKLAAGFYYTSNLYSANTTIPAYLICVDGKNIIIPVQQTAYGELDGTALLSGIVSGSTLNYTVNLGNQGISGSVRKWLRN